MDGREQKEFEMIKDLFGHVRSEQELKDHTKRYIAAERRRRSSHSRVRKVATAFAILFVLIMTGQWTILKATASVQIDGRHSLELGVNRFDQVVSVKGLNDDGQELANTLSLRFQSCTAALNEILKQEENNAALNHCEELNITVICPENAQWERLCTGMQACAKKYRNLRCYRADAEEAKAAGEAGLSCGKYRAYLELKELDPDVTPEELQGLTMREIRDRIASMQSGSAPEKTHRQHHRRK